MKLQGQIYVISGPSGTGKSTVIGLLRKKVTDLGYSISHTTRKPRDGEVDGIHYHFVDQESFEKMISEGGFVEWAGVHQAYYGTSHSALEEQVSLGQDVLMDIDVQGARNMKAHYQDCILIFLLPPSPEVLERRLRERKTETEEVIVARLKKAREEIRNCAWYDFIIFNDHLEKALEETESIILSDRCRKYRQLARVEKEFGPVLR